VARKAVGKDEIFVWIHPDDIYDEKPTKIHTKRLSGEEWYKYRQMRTKIGRRGKIVFDDYPATMYALRQCVIKVENIFDAEGKLHEVVDDQEKAIQLIIHVDDMNWFEDYLNYATKQQEREVDEEEEKN